MSSCACAGIGSGSGPHCTQMSPESARNTAGSVNTPGPASIAAHPVNDSAGEMQMSPPVTTVSPTFETTGVAPRMAQPAAAPSGTTGPPPAPPPPGKASLSPHPVLPITNRKAVNRAKDASLGLFTVRMRVVSLVFREDVWGGTGASVPFAAFRLGVLFDSVRSEATMRLVAGASLVNIAHFGQNCSG